MFYTRSTLNFNYLYIQCQINSLWTKTISPADVQASGGMSRLLFRVLIQTVPSSLSVFWSCQFWSILLISQKTQIRQSPENNMTIL